jgi:hypothetical protein
VTKQATLRYYAGREATDWIKKGIKEAVRITAADSINFIL